MKHRFLAVFKVCVHFWKRKVFIALRCFRSVFSTLRDSFSYSVNRKVLRRIRMYCMAKKKQENQIYDNMYTKTHP